jgi:hypothetical protein
MGRARRVAIRGLGAALLGGAFASCALAGFTVLDGPAPGDAGAGAGGATTSSSTTSSTTSSSASTSSGAGGATCGLATYPGPPSGATVPGQEDFVVAIRSIDFGEGSKSPPGFDLDGRCTCPAGTATPAGCCKSDGPSCAMAKVTCDGPGGVDNASARLFSLLAGFLDNFGSSFFSQRAEQGFWTTLLRVRGYNGEADDDQVEVDWYVSEGYRAVDGGSPAPKWDGTDRWSVSDDSVVVPEAGPPDADHPRWFDAKAYVSNHVLVASLPSSVCRLAGGTSAIDVRVTAGFIVATIAPADDAGSGWALRDGTIAFRWAMSDVFYAISTYRDDAGKPLCTDGTFYKLGRDQLCGAQDITVAPSGPTTPCDAVSAGIAFQAYPAQLGPFYTPAAPSPGCPAATNPANDVCAPPP